MIHRSLTRMGPAARAAALLLVLAGPFAATQADARMGGGFSFGSRGSRSFSMPAPTPTAPRPAQPFGQSEAPRYGSPYAQPRRFGFGSGLLAGLLGAGLLGSLTGVGFFGGIAALFGLLFKVALIGGIVWLLLRLFRARPSTAAAGGAPAYGGPMPRTAPAGLPGGAPRQEAITIGPADYQAFEQTLDAIQAAYSREDVGALGRLATPEVVRRLAADLEENRRRGLRNDISQVRLLQGDLSESWRENGTDYATVAMRFTAVDVMLDRSSGRVAAGDPARPVEAVELWTFRREGRGAWLLSGVQQAG